MAPPISVKRTAKNIESTKKQPKRFKVGRACCSCRVKKIKCDGIQPCMQCKARRLSCTFSTDSDSPVLPQLDMDYNELGSDQTEKQTTRHKNKVDCPSNNNTQQELLENTIKALNYLGDTWSGEVDGDAWCIDEIRLVDQQHINSTTTNLHDLYHRITLPSRKKQKHLIRLYYQHKYPLFHMIPWDVFMQQFDQQQELTVSPLLLLVILAHGAQLVNTEEEEEHYFEQAKGLLDSVLDTPCLDLVVALCLMSLYEPRRGGDYRQPSLYYSAIAFRMCNQLGYGQQLDTLDDGQRELRKRVTWGCYCLDKLQGICYGASWMLRLDDMIMVDLPRCYWPNENQEQLESFVAFIKLMQMAEQSLCPNQFSRQPMTKDYSNALQLDQTLLEWLQALPLHFQWTSLPTSNPSLTDVVNILKDPPRTPWIAQLHLLFNVIEQRILIPFALSSSSSTQLVYQRCLSVASHLTQLVQYMANQPTWILSYALTSTAIMLATRVHLLNCGNYQNDVVTRHARSMYQRGMRSLSTLMLCDKRTIPGVDSFLARVKDALYVANSPTTAKSALVLPPPESDNVTGTINHMYLTESEQVISHAFGGTPLWREQSNQLSEHSRQEQQQQQQQQQHNNSLEFLQSTTVNDIWNKQQQMVPSNVDTIINKSRFLVEDHRQTHQDFIPHCGGLVMSHAKLNDPLLSSTWMMRYTKERQWDMGTTTTEPEGSSSSSLHASPTDVIIPPFIATPANITSNNNNSLFWPTSTSSPLCIPNKTMATTATSGRTFGQYMNIGLGVYASAHQHHNDVIRQHIPDANSIGNNSRSVLLTHQGQVIVVPSGTITTDASNRSTAAGNNATAAL
ncbi:fungal-specific transcription factor domain-containing protein [Chlamydoabsidia padenii]|nr:fungal-specific transcription factor domain-containing protein [Chlamydoabsidia padenii]